MTTDQKIRRIEEKKTELIIRASRLTKWSFDQIDGGDFVLLEYINQSVTKVGVQIPY